MPFGVLAIVAIVVVAVLLMNLARREQGSDTGLTVDGVSPAGLIIGDGLATWESIFEITIVTRRQMGRTWFGFEARSETHGMLLIDGSTGPGEPFLAESHRFPGFDHNGLGEALTTRNARVVCYSR